MSLRRSLTLALTLLLCLTGVAQAKKKSLEGVPLQWRPTDELGDYEAIDLSDVSSVTVEVRPFEDTRDNPELIAENREDEDEGKILRVTTPDDVGEWCSERVAWIMDQFGVETAAEGGDVVLKGEVKRFFVIETNLYDSDIGLKLTVEDRSGNVLFVGLFGGSASRFGRSYKADNYYEVLSDAMIEAVHDALSNEKFMQALAGG